MAEIETSIHEGKTFVHGSAVAIDGRGALIVGASGRGKSALALQLMACGATLIGDDRVELRRDRDGITLIPPPVIAGRIEARGVGILAAATAQATLGFVVDLDHVETDRLPPLRWVLVDSVEVPVIHKVESGHFAAAILQYLKAGKRHDP